MFRPEDFAELTTPAAPNRKGNIFFMARPPLLCEEGNLLSDAGFARLNFGFVKYVADLLEQPKHLEGKNYRQDPKHPDATDDEFPTKRIESVPVCWLRWKPQKDPIEDQDRA